MPECNFTVRILPFNENPSSISITKTAVINGTTVGSTINYTFSIENTGLQNLTDIKLTDNKLGLSMVTIPNLVPGQVVAGPAVTYVLNASDVTNSEVVNTVLISAVDENLITVNDSDTLITPLVLPNLFFTEDGVNPIGWNDILDDYTLQCFRVDGDDTLIRGITEATAYINTNYPGQVLNTADGTWVGPFSGPIQVHDATMLFTIETTVVSETTVAPITTALGSSNNIIDWGDGSPPEVFGASVFTPSHTYTTPGTYQVSVCADLTAIDWGFQPNTVKQQLISIDQWGDTGATLASFARSNNITSIDPNLPSSITSLDSFLAFSSSNPDLSGLDVSNVENFGAMFFLNFVATPNTVSWDVSSATEMNDMFNNAVNANPVVTTWDVSNVSNFDSMFENADSFTGDVSNWNMSNAIFIQEMFQNAALINPDVSNWDVSNVQNMSGIFNNADSAVPDVSNWNTTSTTNMSFMFANTLLANPDVSGFDTSNVQNFSGMFNNTSVAAPNTTNWNTSSATNMSSMFTSAQAANPDVSGWDTSLVTNMSAMFQNTLVASPDVSGFNVSNVTNFSNMFNTSPNSNPDVSGFDIQSINLVGLSVLNMFNGSGISVTNYDAALIQFNTVASANTLTGFNLGTVPSSFTIATSGAARTNLVGPLTWTITDLGGI